MICPLLNARRAASRCSPPVPQRSDSGLFCFFPSRWWWWVVCDFFVCAVVLLYKGALCLPPKSHPSLSVPIHAFLSNYYVAPVPPSSHSFTRAPLGGFGFWLRTQGFKLLTVAPPAWVWEAPSPLPNPDRRRQSSSPTPPIIHDTMYDDFGIAKKETGMHEKDRKKDKNRMVSLSRVCVPPPWWEETPIHQKAGDNVLLHSLNTPPHLSRRKICTSVCDSRFGELRGASHLNTGPGPGAGVGQERAHPHPTPHRHCMLTPAAPLTPHHTKRKEKRRRHLFSGASVGGWVGGGGNSRQERRGEPPVSPSPLCPASSPRTPRNQSFSREAKKKGKTTEI